MCLTVTSDRDEIEKHPTGRPLDGRDFVPSRKHSQEDFSTDSIVRKPDDQRTRFHALAKALPRALFDRFDRP